MRLTMLARSTTGIAAKVKARTQKQRERIKQATVNSADRVFNRVLADANYDTGYMLSQTRLEFTQEGYNFAVGYRSEDFIGQTNDLADPPFLITSFYPVFVILGTRFYVGNDFLAAALRAEKRNIRQGYVRALNVR